MRLIRRKVRIIFCLLIISLVVYIIYYRSCSFVSVQLPAQYAISDTDQHNFHLFNALVSVYRQCLLSKLRSKVAWDLLHQAIQECLRRPWWSWLDIKILANKADMKWIMLPNSMQFFNCIHLTLGIGGDIDAEKRLRSLLPSCRFYGAEPIKHNGEVFSELGQWYQVGVGAKAGLQNASVLQYDHYETKQVRTITLLDLIRNYAKIDHVDYLWMDIEGPEYSIFPQLLPDGDLDKSNISICQITVEMHGPLKDYTDETSVDILIKAMIEISSFLPFWSLPTEKGVAHIRTFYANVHDEYCREKFFAVMAD